MSESVEYISTYIKELVSKIQLEIMMDANHKLIHLYFHIGRVLKENSSWVINSLIILQIN